MLKKIIPEVVSLVRKSYIKVTMMLIMFCIVHVMGYSGSDEFINDLDKPVPLAHVQGVVGQRASLPCDTRPLHSDDLVSMVLWFKEAEGEPLYSYDVRGRPASQPALWSAPGGFGARAHFRAAAPAALLLHSVRAADAGIYRCRVDFKNSPTRNLRLNFTVITPPHRPTILDASTRDAAKLLQPYNEGDTAELRCETYGAPPHRPTILDASTRDAAKLLQPYNEGDTAELRCETYGGDPRPSLTWYLENTLIDDSFEQLPDGVTVNTLTLSAVGRQHLNARLSCQAANTNLAPPETKLVILDVYLKPLSVQILNKSRQLSADKSYEIKCQSVGSRPDATISWWKGGRPIRRSSKNFSDNNVTISVLSLTPLAEDHERTLICRAENLKIPSSIIEDKWRLNVHYVPEVTIEMGSSLNPELIKEGDDVYFECRVNANPKTNRLAWFKENVEIQHNVPAGIILSDRSLVLQRVNRSAAGDYRCLAQNTEGSTYSNYVTLIVRYAPICNNANQVEVHGALKQESVELACSVDASPPPQRFVWALKAAGEHTFLTDSEVSNSGHTSTLTYTPLRDSDYGTILCSATNPVGTQETPCLYKLVAAGKPMPVQNCTYNHSSESVRVDCTQGYDGGLPQVFYMEVLQMPSYEVEANLSSSLSPKFEYRGLDSKTSYNLKIYAANSKGQSESVTINTLALRPPDKYTGNRTSPVPPWLVGLLCAGALLSAGVCAVLAALYTKHFSTSGDNKNSNTPDSSNLFMDRSMDTLSKQDITYAAAAKLEYCSQLELKVDQDDTDPDIIPYGYEKKCLENFNITTPNFGTPAICGPEVYSCTRENISVVNRGVTARSSDITRRPEIVTSSRTVKESCI